MGDVTARWPDSKFKMDLGDSKGLDLRKIKAALGTNARSVVIKFTAKVTATVAKSSGMSEAAQLALLKLVTVKFGTDLGNANYNQTPYSGANLAVLRRNQQLLTETELTGFKDSAGLAKPLVVGVNSVSWESVLPLGHVEFIDESRQLGGMGDLQLLMSSVTLGTGNEPLAAVDADLRVNEISSVEFYPDQQPTIPGTQRWGHPVLYETKNSTDAQGMETGEGLVLFVGDTAQPLSSTLYQTIRVAVGGYGAAPAYVPTDDPCTPLNVEANFSRQPESGAVEKSVNTQVTPLFRQSDKPLAEMVPGKVSVYQIIKATGFNLEILRMPFLMEDYYFQVARKIAEEWKKDVHCVSSATVLGLKVEDRQLPYVGFHFVDTSHQLAKLYCGLRCTPEGKVSVFIPPTRKLAAGQLFGLGRSVGDAGAVLKALRMCGDEVPGTVMHPALGYAGGDGWVSRDIMRQLGETADALEKQARG